MYELFSREPTLGVQDFVLSREVCLFFMALLMKKYIGLCFAIHDNCSFKLKITCWAAT